MGRGEERDDMIFSMSYMAMIGKNLTGKSKVFLSLVSNGGLSEAA